ncbi:reticulon-1-B isoform X2 [Glossina fuscipes]|uniref:Reticulon-like protein n=1 Tax=Glossina fuscipes TaxID=7396 RepID=A0A8U0WEP0_9MUSC|nr:reticulon-1-B isoform X2 [Glossina fuscipes]
MDFNLTNPTNKPSVRSDDIFTNTAEVGKQTSQDLLGDIMDKSGTLYSDIGDQKDSDFEHIDAQAFVQRMSAGAKEAQEQLDAKFSQAKNDYDDFLGQNTQKIKQGVASATSDFMNAERGFVGDILTKAEKKASETAGDILNIASHLGSGDANFINQVASVNSTTQNLIGDNNLTSSGKTSSTVTGNANVNKKDSDTESPSISHNPSPAKKLPVTDALKEQDNEKFISSEDLLSDFKEDSQLSGKTSSQKQTDVVKNVIDLDTDDDDDFVQAEIPKMSEDLRPVTTTKIEPSVPAKPIKTEVEPIKPKPAVIENKKPLGPHAPIVATKPTTTTVTVKKTLSSQQPQIISVEDIFYKYGLVESLIYWRDVKKSGIVFGAGLITLLAISCCSVISVFAYLSLTILSGTIAFRIYKSVMQAIQKTSDGHPFKEYLDYDLTLSQDKVQHIAGVAVAHVNGFVAEMRRLFLVEDLVDSIKFGVILCVMTYIGAWFNGMTLVIMAFVSLFTLPKVYENNKQSIDTYLDLARSKVADVTEKIKAAIPLGTKKPIAAESDKDK